MADDDRGPLGVMRRPLADVRGNPRNGNPDGNPDGRLAQPAASDGRDGRIQDDVDDLISKLDDARRKAQRLRQNPTGSQARAVQDLLGQAMFEATQVRTILGDLP